jgi:hypothetical protein
MAEGMSKAMNENEMREEGDDVEKSEKPTPEVRVITVHLEPVLLPRRSSHLERLGMHSCIEASAIARAQERVSSAQFEEDVNAILEPLLAPWAHTPGASLQGAHESSAYLKFSKRIPPPPFRQPPPRFESPPPVTKMPRGKKTSETSIESVGYYTQTSTRPKLQTPEIEPEPEPLDWLQHEFPTEESAAQVRQRQKEIKDLKGRPKNIRKPFDRKTESFRAVGL